MPKISLAYTSGVVTPRPSTSSRISVAASQRYSAVEGDDREEMVEATDADVRYDDVMRNAICAPSPMPATTGTNNAVVKKNISMGFGRKKSLKGR